MTYIPLPTGVNGGLTIDSTSSITVSSGVIVGTDGLPQGQENKSAEIISHDPLVYDALTSIDERLKQLTEYIKIIIDL